MKSSLLILASGALGCALSLTLILTGLVTVPAPEATKARPNQEPVVVQDFGKDIESIRAESRALQSRIAAVESSLSAVVADVRATKDSPAPTKTPDKEQPPAHVPASPESEAAWLRLMLRQVRPKAYEDAREIIDKRFVPALKKYFLDRKTCVGAEFESLMPSSLGKTVWRWNDFSFTVKNVNEAEIQLDADPELPKLKATITFGDEVKKLDDQMEMVAWNKMPDWQEQVPLPRGEARVSTGRASLGAIKDRIRVYYARKNALPKTFADLGMSEAELQSDDFNASDYSFSGTEEVFVITCRNVFKDDPYDLILTVNLKTGDAAFNR
jgi:hypothetical protein